jgi:hypothetical protein
MFVLKELARHEYAHYLISRYLVNGMWGETDMYDNSRMVWFDEGLANYMTGATQANGTVPLSTMIDMKNSAAASHTVSDVTNTTYNDNWMYPYSALLFNYMDSINSDTLVLLSAALVADDTAEFDSIASGLSTLDAGFQTYINGLTTDGWEAPWWEYKVGALLEDSNVTNIQAVLTDAFSTTTCVEADESNFSCTFNLETSGSTFAQVEATNSALNAGILTALQAGPNNIETMTCHPIVLGSTAECIGMLRPDSVDYDSGEPVDSDGDGVPDVDDAFPNDPSEWADTDGDGTGDNADVFPNDATETTDTDGDSVGDNADAFPNDATEWADSDGDTYGDNSDAFPNDSTEWLDTDGDGYGDNSDFYPSDASKWQQETTPVVTPPAAKSSSSGGSFGFSIMLMMLIGITRFRQK